MLEAMPALVIITIAMALFSAHRFNQARMLLLDAETKLALAKRQFRLAEERHERADNLIQASAELRRWRSPQRPN